MSYPIFGLSAVTSWSFATRDSIKHCGPCRPRVGQTLPFPQFSEVIGRSEKLRRRRRSSVLLEIVAELLDIVCEDLAYISIDVPVRNNSKAIDHLSVWRHGVSEKEGFQLFSRTLFEMSKPVHMPCGINYRDGDELLAERSVPAVCFATTQRLPRGANLPSSDSCTNAPPRPSASN